MHFHWMFFMPSAIVFHQADPPENLKFEPVTVQAPLPGQIRLRQTAIGVNFHDTYVRSGLYQTLALPGIPGIEGVGIVTELGEGVRHRSEEHTSELQSLMRISYAAFCLKKKKQIQTNTR